MACIIRVQLQKGEPLRTGELAGEVKGCGHKNKTPEHQHEKPGTGKRNPKTKPPSHRNRENLDRLDGSHSTTDAPPTRAEQPPCAQPNPKEIEMNEITATAKLIKLTSHNVGVIIRYAGERFDVERARENGYGAVEIFNWYGDCHGLSVQDQVEVLGYYNT
jgi:hypothetical protein